jgi:hypothetical protein
MRNLPVLNLDDRAKTIVVFHGRREDGSVDFIFDNDAIVRLVGDELIRRVKRDITDVPP